MTAINQLRRGAMASVGNLNRLPTDAWRNTYYGRRVITDGGGAPRHGASVPDVQFKVASCPCERRGAFELVYRRYLEAGLIEPNRFRLRVTPFHLLSSTTIFIGVVDGCVTCTVTLIRDGALGLPLERVYARAVEQKRRSGLALGEVSCLAFRRGFDRAQSWVAFLGINRHMAQFARQHGLDALVIATHPRHARVYHRVMGFEPIGDVSLYPSVRNHPAIACCLDYESFDRKGPLYDKIFGIRIPPQQLMASPMSHAEAAELADAAKLTGDSILPLQLAVA